MKVFIVFIALLIVNINMIIFNDDIALQNRFQESIKNVAENCAYGSAMYYDQEKYGDGIFVFNQEEAMKYIEYEIQRYKDSGKGKGSIKGINYKVYFLDDSGKCSIYENGIKIEESDFEYPFSIRDGQGLEQLIEEPVVKVDIRVDTGDLFRQDFIESNSIYRSSSYGEAGC